MSPAYPDWADERDEDYYDNTTEVAQERQTRNRILMQMPKSSLTARRQHHQTAGSTYVRKRSKSPDRDLDWAMADHEIESSEEEDSDSDSSDHGRRRVPGRGYNGSDSDFDDEY